MNYLFFLLFCIFIVNFTYAEWLNKSFKHNNLTREYRVYLPDNYDETKVYKLVVGVHGLGSNMTDFSAAFYNFCKIADTADIILVFPQGYDKFFLGRGWNAGAGTLVNIRVLELMIKVLSTQLPIQFKPTIQSTKIERIFLDFQMVDLWFSVWRVNRMKNLQLLLQLQEQ